MISKTNFVRIMEQCETIENIINGLSNVLGYMESNLDQPVCDIMDSIGTEMEPNRKHWVDDNLAVFRYAYDFQWGSGWNKYVDTKAWPIGNTEYDVYDLETLYDYIIAKEDYYKKLEDIHSVTN